MQNEQDYVIVKKVVHGVEVEVKVYPVGASNYVSEDELDELIELFNRADDASVTVKKTGIEHYTKAPE
jgi:hypothetical protein